jgi:hypothetical protein
MDKNKEVMEDLKKRNEEKELMRRMRWIWNLEQGEPFLKDDTLNNTKEEKEE